MPLPNPSRLSPAPRPLTAVAALSLAIACLLLPALLPAEETLSVGPTVSLSGPTYTLGNHPYEVTITFSESVTGFEQGDVTVGNASASAFSGSGASYSITITPSASGAVTVDVAANVATDSEGNGNSAATRYSATADLDPPSVQITGPSGAQTGAFTVSVAFSEAVGVHGHPFEKGDVTVGNGSVTGFSGSGASYSVTVTPSAAGTVTVSVAAGVARDAGGNANTASSQFSVQAKPNSPPVITAPGNKTYQQGQAITTISIPVSEPDGDSFGMTIVGLPSGLSWSWDETSKSLQVTGTVSSTATAQAYTVTIEANEANDGLKAEATFTITVTEPSSSRKIYTPSDQTFQQGQTISAITVKVLPHSPRGVGETVTGLPSGLSFTQGAPGEITGTVADDAAPGAYTVTITADSGESSETSSTFTITVTASAPPANSPPGISMPGNQTYRQGQAITAIDFKVTDVDGDEVTLTVSGLPAGLAYTNALLQGTVSATATAQDYTVTVSADDGVNTAVTGTFTITVTANSPPAITVPGNQTYQQGQAITAIDFKVTDVDGDEVTLTVSGLPAGLSYTNALLQGTVSASATAQDYTVTVSADDGVNTAVTGTFTITVTEPSSTPPANSPPAISMPGNQTYQQGQTITAIDFKVTDVDGDEVTLTVSGLPAGLSYTNALLQGTVSASATAQDYTVTVSADDGANAAVTGTFTITVTEPSSTPPANSPPASDPPASNPPANSPPVITAPGDKTYQQGQTITAFGIPVTDADGDGMGISMWGLPSGLSWSWDEDSDSIQVTGTVSATATTQAYTVTVEANEVNDQDAAVRATFTITVVGPNSPPEIREPNGVYGIQYHRIVPFDIRASDPDGDAVTVTVTGLPPGLSYSSYSSASGRVSGIPMADEPRIPALRDRTFGMTVTADDGVNPAVTRTFSYFVVYAPPRITVPDDKTFAQGETIAAFDITVDVDPEYKTVEVTGLPEGLSYADDQVQGTVSPEAESKDYTVTISADGDGEGGTVDYAPVTATFTITVTEPVTVAIAGPAEAQDGAFDVTITFSESVTGFAQTMYPPATAP